MSFVFKRKEKGLKPLECEENGRFSLFGLNYIFNVSLKEARMKKHLKNVVCNQNI